MGFIRMIVRQLWHKWFKPLDHDTYLVFKKSLSENVSFYRVYCKVTPGEADYNTLHFEVSKSQVDSHNNNKLRVRLNPFLLNGIIYNLGVTAVSKSGNESDIVTLNNVIL